MKLCYVLDFPVLNIDGPAINEIEFINSLENQNLVEVCYFLCKTNETLIKNSKNRFILFQGYQNKSIKYLFIKTVKIFYQFLRFYAREKPEIIVTRLGHVPFLQYLISILFGKKLFVKTVGRFWSINQLRSFKDIVYNFLIIYLNKHIIKNARGLDTVTENFRYIFSKKYKVSGDRIEVIENSVNTNFFTPKNVDKKWNGADFNSFFPILGYIGNLPFKRGARQLFDIYDQIKSIYPRLAVIIVGNDEQIIKLRDRACDEKKDVFFLGEVLYAYIPYIMNFIDIGYSFTTSQDYKEVGNSSQKLRQYLSCGKPVITMKGTNHFVSENDFGSLVDQDNIEEIVQETIRWISRIEMEKDVLTQRLHKYAREHLSTQKALQKRLDFWQEILEK